MHDLACGWSGLAPEDLLFSIQPAAIATDRRGSARRALELVARLSSEFPDCGVIVDLSRFLDGVAAPADKVLAHVFLRQAKERGVSAAIADVSAFGPTLSVPDPLRRAAEALILVDGQQSTASLDAFVSLCAGANLDTGAAKALPTDVGERLKQRIVDGDGHGMEADLDEALRDHAALDIITEFLLGGMKVVGELFGDGRIPLPHVLKSAETMKAAVAHLEPRMERTEGRHRGAIVLATVKGDIHDIGKNLVDIVLSNSGYRTVNLGSKQSIEAILAAAREYKADAIGMSGLLLNSAIVMRKNLEEMTRQGVVLPVLLGGAALSRRFVAENCAPAYRSGQVAYAGDVFDGLRLMGAIVAGRFDQVATRARNDQSPSESAPEPAPELHDLVERPMDLEETSVKRAGLQANVAVPTPPFFGAKVVRLSVDALLPYLNRTMLYMFHWGYKKAGRSLQQWRSWSEEKLRPILEDLLERCRKEDILAPCAVYGYWRCAASGNTLVLFEDDDKTEAARFAFPRQRCPGGLCIADFFRQAGLPGQDVVALQAVTVGQRASDVAREWYRADQYQDYLFLHGLAVELTEAAAEFVHRKVRSELCIVGDDAADMELLLKQTYRGSRFSFGYPACPNLEDQRVVLKLLDAGRIGLTMAEEGQLHPELATAAIVAHHPQARYFSV
jgi:5-methyltetrahydrofolate--homocysteine methyltransferase